MAWRIVRHPIPSAPQPAGWLNLFCTPEGQGTRPKHTECVENPQEPVLRYGYATHCCLEVHLNEGIIRIGRLQSLNKLHNVRRPSDPQAPEGDRKTTENGRPGHLVINQSRYLEEYIPLRSPCDLSVNPQQTKPTLCFLLLTLFTSQTQERKERHKQNI